MLALIVSIITGIALVTLAGNTNSYDSMTEYARTQYQREHIIAVASGVESFYRENGYYPTSLQALGAAPGYEPIRGALEFNMGYVTSGTLNDGTWQYQRAVAFLVPANTSDTIATYATKNYCGTGPAASAQNWCGNQQGLYYRRETRDTINEDLTTQQVRLIRLQLKFSRYYNANQKYPDKDGSNNPLGASSLSKMADLVGYGGTAANCSGNYQYMGIPIDCGDIFDRWGNYVTYQFESSAHVIFISETPFINAAGVRQIVAVDRM